MRDIVSTSGTELDHIVYDSFGNIVTETNAANGDRFKFAGMQYDATTGQYYDHARWYGSGIRGDSWARIPRDSERARPTSTDTCRAGRLTALIHGALGLLTLTPTAGRLGSPPWFHHRPIRELLEPAHPSHSAGWHRRQPADGSV